MLWDIFRYLIVFASLWIMLFFTIFFHEMGHVLMYVIFYRRNDWLVELGIGKPRLLELGKFCICPVMISGKAYCPRDNTNKFKTIMVSFGRPMVNFLFIFLLKICLDNIDFGIQIYLHWIVNTLYYINIYQFLGAIIPIKTENYTSDGMKILDVIRGQ